MTVIPPATKTCITRRRAMSLAAIFMLSASVAHYGISESRRLNDAKSIPESLQEIDQQQFQVSINSNHIIINPNQRRGRRRLQEEQEKSEVTLQREKHLGFVFPEPEKMPLYLRSPLEPLHPDDIVFFWHIPKSGGQLVKVIMGSCFGLRRAEKLENPAKLEFIKDNVVNVDTATPKGIEQAQSFQLADSGMIDMITSSYVLSASSLFTAAHKGRAFTIMRHPVDAAANNFFARKRTRPDLRTMTLAQYANQDWYPDNWMVRQLTGTLPGVPLNEFHLDKAKNLLMAKFFIGISDQLEETVRQLRLYYKWKPRPGKEACEQQLVTGEGSDFKFEKRPTPGRGSDDWITVATKEKWDLELYYLALELFSRQSLVLKPMENTDTVTW